MRNPFPGVDPFLERPGIWSIDLGAVYNHAYECGRYSRRLKHFERPNVPLRDDDLPWAIECSRNRS
ncbi:MAG TPA: hypothetical protein VJ783_26950 [Pirellulales bacterium]|nr:hypothetical protein [Pirellulales bacterium]